MRPLAGIVLCLCSGCGISFSAGSPPDDGGGGAAATTSPSSGGTGGVGGAGGTEPGPGAGGEPGTGGAPFVPPCHPPGLSDPFDVGVDQTVWTHQGKQSIMAVAGGLLEITPEDDQPDGQWVGLVTQADHDVDECAVWIEVPQVITGGMQGDTYFQLYASGLGSTNIRVEQGMLRSHVTDAAGELASAETTYDPSAHRWWMIREQGDRIYLETSADFQRWTVLLDSPSPSYVGATQIGLGVVSPSETASIGKGQFDNFDTEP